MTKKTIYRSLWVLAIACAFACGVLYSATFGALAAIFFSLGLAIWLFDRFKLSADKEDEISKMVSIVGLFSELPYLDEEILTSYASDTWNIEFETGNDATTFVAGDAPLFVIKTEDRMYAVNYFDRPYFENIDEVVEEVAELRTRNVLESHRGWVSVDLLTEAAPGNQSHEYALIGSLLNRIVDENCLGVLVPQIMKLVPWDESVEAALIGPDPVAALSADIPGVVPMDDDDPKLRAATIQARKSWPKFVTAFENHMRDEDREEGRNFSVKAPITAGECTEYIWVTVTCIENEIIYGKLGNEPLTLEGMREGDLVRFPVSELDDWVYTDGSNAVGGYTIKVISEWANRFKSKS